MGFWGRDSGCAPPMWRPSPGGPAHRSPSPPAPHRRFLNCRSLNPETERLSSTQRGEATRGETSAHLNCCREGCYQTTFAPNSGLRRIWRWLSHPESDEPSVGTALCSYGLATVGYYGPASQSLSLSHKVQESRLSQQIVNLLFPITN